MDESEIVNDVARIATRAFGGIISKYKRTGCNLYETFTKFYESCFQPVMLYGAGLWGVKEYKTLNAVQNRACKYFLGVPKTTFNRQPTHQMLHGKVIWVSCLLNVNKN